MLSWTYFQRNFTVSLLFYHYRYIMVERELHWYEHFLRQPLQQRTFPRRSAEHLSNVTPLSLRPSTPIAIWWKGNNTSANTFCVSHCNTVVSRRGQLNIFPKQLHCLFAPLSPPPILPASSDSIPLHKQRSQACSRVLTPLQHSSWKIACVLSMFQITQFSNFRSGRPVG